MSNPSVYYWNEDEKKDITIEWSLPAAKFVITFENGIANWYYVNKETLVLKDGVLFNNEESNDLLMKCLMGEIENGTNNQT